MTAEIPKIAHAMGAGTASSDSRSEPEVAAVGVTIVAPGAAAGFAVAGVMTGALRTFGGGAVMSGCVFAIFTAGASVATGSGRMLMRAVSFFGSACAADPG